MNFRVIATLGPSILDKKKLKEVDSCGECIYRINGAHVDKKQAAQLISLVRKILPDPKIMLCLPGNKMRTANLSEPIRLVKGERFTLHDYEINFPSYIEYLKKGNIMLSNDSRFTFEVINVKELQVELLSHSNGLLYSNKGLNVKGLHAKVPFFFEKDKELAHLACSESIAYLALSFVRTKEDICVVKKILANPKVDIIAKIETMEAVRNLGAILCEVNSILIDRGDLSTEVGMLQLSDIQDKVIRTAVESKKDVYLATHFLKNMETNPVPLIPEIIDLTKTLRTGIAGIQLSEETAIGKYPVECVRTVFDVLKNSKNEVRKEKKTKV